MAVSDAVSDSDHENNKNNKSFHECSDKVKVEQSYSKNEIRGKSNLSTRNRKGLVFAHLNTRSVRYKMDEIKLIAENEDIDIFTISESWLDENISDSEVNIPGFTMFRRDRKQHIVSDVGHGGTLCYVKDHINATYRNDLNNNSDIEALWVELKPRNVKPILVCTFYRPPGVDVSYFKRFDEIVQSINSDDTVILGDFNLDCLTDSTSKKVSEFCVNNQLTQLVDEPTRVTENTSTLIDLICVSKPEDVSYTNVVYSNVSDHYLVKFCKKHKKGHTNPRTTTGRCYKKFSNFDFVKDIASINWNDIVACDICNDPSVAWDTWKNMFLKVCNKHAPFRSRQVKGHLPPWITPEYKQLAHERDYMKRKAQLSNNPLDWASARAIRNKVNMLNRSLKRNYFHDVIKTNVNNSIKLWKTLREYGGLGSKSSAPTRSGDCKDNVTFVNEINDHFCTVGHNVCQSSDVNDMHSSENSVSDINDVCGTFKLQSISNEYVLKQLRSVSLKKATGVDNIPAKLLKLAAPYVSNVLAHICNLSLQKGIVPDEWKEARVTPIHKGGDQDDLNNFRPISVLPIISKVIERFVHDELYSYLQCNNILCIEQSGFRPYHSTETALLDVTDSILKAMDRKKATAIVFLDLRKAFDCVNHDLLLQKLHNIGVNDIELKWFTSYLSGRTQATVLNGVTSDKKCINIGVPQGSILGPLLFSIFVNDLPKILSCKTTLYADDTALTYSCDNVDEMCNILNENLSQVDLWLRKNQLSLNVSKSKYMICGTKHCVEKFNTMNLMIRNVPIERVDSYKYLGVWFDSQLKWDINITNICKKVSQRIGLIRRLRHFVPTNVTKLLASSLAIPYFEYCNLVWYNSSQCFKNNLQILFNKLARVVLNEGPRAHIDEMFHTLGWQTLDVRSNINVACMVFKCMKGEAPCYLNRIFTRVSDHHSYNTKSNVNGCLKQYSAKTQSGQRTFHYRGAAEWNELPSHIRSLDNSVKHFKSKMCEFY